MRNPATLALLSITLASPAFGWGSLGHRAVAQIAQERLSPEAAKRLETLLGAPNALGRVASCADYILHARKPVNCGGLIELPPDGGRETAHWHYMNIPLAARLSASNIARHCPDKDDCVWAQIPRAAKALGSEPDAQKRKVALMYLVHLVGDIHQPLHVADNGDRGGTQSPVTIPGVQKSLHSAWDGLLMIREWQSRGGPEAEEEDGDFDALMAKLRDGLSRADTGSWLHGDTVAASVLEGHAFARDSIYPSYSRTGGKLDGAYQDEMQPAAYERLMRGGVRLAALLEKALGDGPAERLLDAKLAGLSIDRAVSGSPVR